MSLIWTRSSSTFKPLVQAFDIFYILIGLSASPIALFILNLLIGASSSSYGSDLQWLEKPTIPKWLSQPCIMWPMPSAPDPCLTILLFIHQTLDTGLYSGFSLSHASSIILWVAGPQRLTYVPQALWFMCIQLRSLTLTFNDLSLIIPPTDVVTLSKALGLPPYLVFAGLVKRDKSKPSLNPIPSPF